MILQVNLIKTGGYVFYKIMFFLLGWFVATYWFIFAAMTIELLKDMRDRLVVLRRFL
jgi:hypothetical protein